MNDLRERLATMTPEELKSASFECEIGEWRAVNRFCGKCGAAMRPHKMLVTKGDEIRKTDLLPEYVVMHGDEQETCAQEE